MWFENDFNWFKNKLIELSEEIATINEVRNEIDFNLIEEMNKAIKEI